MTWTPNWVTGEEVLDQDLDLRLEAVDAAALQSLGQPMVAESFKNEYEILEHKATYGGCFRFRAAWKSWTRLLGNYYDTNIGFAYSVY